MFNLVRLMGPTSTSTWRRPIQLSNEVAFLWDDNWDKEWGLTKAIGRCFFDAGPIARKNKSILFSSLDC
jgi:hypothetical protein